MTPRLPEVKLDTTVAELYHQGSPSLRDRQLAHVFCGVTSVVDLTPTFPANVKYIYQDSAFGQSVSEEQKPELQRSLAVKYLSLIAQRDAFITGKAPVVLFYTGQEPVSRAQDEREIQNTLRVLPETQKPQLIFCDGPRQMWSELAKYGIDAVTAKLVVDDISEDSESRMLVNGDLLWYLNTKEALARSGLPTPVSEIIETKGYGVEAASCCEACRREARNLIAEKCGGSRDTWLQDQIARILTAINHHQVPFVLKGQQSFGGAGTYVVRSDQDREELVKDFTSGGTLRKLLSYINASNQHLRLGTILITDFVKDPIADFGVTFFVNEDGSSIFLGASEQMIDRENAAWVGSKISYSRQKALEQKFRQLVDQVAVWLHKQKYIGPAGIDILETREAMDSADGSTTMHIVDLNVRTSGSLCLPLLRSHFTSRGLDSASSLSITLEEGRDSFSERWQAELEAGKMCVLAWYEDQRSGKSVGDVVIGAEDEAGLAKSIEKVRGDSEQVTF